ncbi:hypothetical protein B0A53_00964 [Rhodotorula sp. CCFEE 5036]|nr:hypothetical protein B0A53_00964 [Rhodotorula sp. CCFEE 5036]
MHATAALTAVIAAAASAQAFAGTYPILAWSRTSLSSSLAELDAASPKQASRTSQQRLIQTGTDDAELCQLDKLYVVSAPGLHASDLARFPSIADSPDGVRSAARAAQESGGTVQVVPYVSDRLAVAPVGKIARRFRRCPGKSEAVQFVRFEGLLEGGDDATTEDEWRRMALQRLDSDVAQLVSSAPAHSAFFLTDLPTSLSSSTTTVTKKLAKRQQLLPSDTSDETLEEMLEEIAEEEHVKSEAFDDMLAEIEGSSVPVAATLNEDDEPVSASSDEYASAVDPYSHGEWDGSVLDVSNGFQRGGSSSGNDTDGHNGTSIFQPEDGSGLLHRYALFSPALIVAVLITFVVLIPTVIVGAQALLSIETVNGLETKMTGSVGIDPSKQ